MDNVIHLAKRLQKLYPEGEGSLGHETFLLEEGLELIAAYRAIECVEVRLSLLHLVKAMGKSSRPGPPAGPSI